MSSFPRVKPTAVLPVLLVTVLLLLPSALFGQATTGSVTGIVADSTGAVVPHVTVELTNGQTGIARDTVSNGVGYFVFASVETSTNYTVSVSVPGFRPWKSQPFALRPGDQINIGDMKLIVGAETEQVTVEATSPAMKDLSSGERADVITAKEIATLAVVGRDATELVRMLPGFDMSSGSNGVGNKPGYNAAVVGLSGPTGSFSANGSGTNGITVVSDGVSLTDISSNAGTVQNVNVDMVEEVKVSTSSYGAENAKGPAIVNAIGKSGSSSFHGSGYFYARDTLLNANDWYNNHLRQTRPDGRYFYPGGTLGGPLLLPGTSFNRSKDKLFFFAGFEYSNQLFSPATLGSWVPTESERKGRFDQSSLDAELCGARPDGNANPNAILPMCETENWLPDGSGVTNGDVSGQANSSGVALINWLPKPNADPFTNADGFNYVKEVLQTQNGTQFHSKLDYHVTQNDTLTVGYNRQSQIQQDPVGYGYIPTNTILYPGSVTSGDLSNSIFASYTRIFRVNLTNEASLAMSFVSSPGNMGTPAAVDRFEANSYNGGNGNYNYLGMYKNAGDYSLPALNPGNGEGFPSMLMPGGFYNNKVRMKKAVPDVQDTLTWVKGTQLIKAGFYAEKGILNGLADTGAFPQGELDFNPGNSYFIYNSNSLANQTAQFTTCENPDPAGNNRIAGAAYLGECMNPNALMFMGYANQYTQTNFSPTVDMQYATYSGFVNDIWKLHNFTFNLGIRLEHIGAWSDRHGNGLATFDSSLYGSQCSGGGAEGTAGRTCSSLQMPGITWHSLKSGVANSVNQPSKILPAPRVGMAWDVFGKGNTVIRGGWGMYRSQEEFNPYALAAATAQGYKTSLLQGQLTFDTIDNQSPLNPPDFSAYTISPKDTDRPYHLEYNLTVSQAITWHRLPSFLEVSFVGSDGEHLNTYNNSYNSISNFNLIPYGGLFGKNDGKDNPLNQLPSTMTASQGGTPDLSGLTTPEQDFFRPYPFYSNIYELKHTYYSTYNSGQISWNKSSGRIQFGGNYTFSKNLATAASWNNNVPNPFNLRDEYNPTPYDHTHVFNVHYLADLGTHYHLGFRPLNELINGWQISGISTLQSGPPLASIQGGNFGFGYGLITPVQTSYRDQSSPGSDKNPCQNIYNIPADANNNHYCTTQLNPTVWLGTPDIQLMPTISCNPSGGPAENQFINGTCFGIPLPLANGQLRPPYIHGPAFMNHDLSLLKDFGMGEKRKLQFRAAAFNFLNHPLVSFNNNNTQTDLALTQQGGTAGQALTQTDLTEKGFGIAGIKYGGRLLELSVKYEF